MLADKRDPNLNHGAILRLRIKLLEISNQRPDAILILDVIEAAQLSRHGQSQQQEMANFSGAFESQTRAEGSYIDEV